MAESENISMCIFMSITTNDFHENRRHWPLKKKFSKV